MALNSKHYRPQLWELYKENMKALAQQKEYIFAPKNKYNYHININHSSILPLWTEYCNDWENDDNIEQIGEMLWSVQTCIGDFVTDKVYDYTDRRLQFEQIILRNEFWRAEMQKEIEEFGLSFTSRTGINPNDILQQAIA